MKFVLDSPNYQANWTEEIKGKFQIPLTNVLGNNQLPYYNNRNTIASDPPIKYSLSISINKYNYIVKSRMDSFLPVTPSTTLIEAIRLFSYGIHRLPGNNDQYPIRENKEIIIINSNGCFINSFEF